MNEIGALPKHLTEFAPEAAPKPKNVIQKDDFMKLLMVQLKHQDPINPMNHQEFATQLAQFGQLEQLTNIGTGIRDLKTGMGEEAKVQALGMIGKTIKTSGNSVELVPGSPVALQFEAKEGITPVRATVIDESGKPVREMDLAKLRPGDPIEWDGKDTQGTAMPAGRYSFRVNGVGKDGQAQEMGTETSGTVTGIDLGGKGPVLLVKNGKNQTRIELSQVRNVSLPEPEAKTAVAGAPAAAPAPKVSPQMIAAAMEQAEGEEEEPMRTHGDMVANQIGGRFR